MPETPALSEKQLEAIALLVSGMSQAEVAKRLDLSRKTINRWCQTPGFKTEVERRKQRTTELHQQESDRLQGEAIATFYADVRKYRKACLDSYKTRLSLAVKALQLISQRVEKMTSAEIPAQLLPAYLGAINSLMDSSLAGWADTLAIDELIGRLSEEDGTESGG